MYNLEKGVTMKQIFTITLFASLFLNSGLCAMEKDRDIEFKKLIEFSEEELNLLQQQEEEKNYVQCTHCQRNNHTSIIIKEDLYTHIRSRHIVKNGSNPILHCNLCEKKSNETVILKNENEISKHIQTHINNSSQGDYFVITSKKPKRRNSPLTDEEIDQLRGRLLLNKRHNTNS
jgi:hypothetical protein